MLTPFVISRMHACESIMHEHTIFLLSALSIEGRTWGLDWGLGWDLQELGDRIDF